MKTKSLLLILLLALCSTLVADRFAAEPKEVVRYIDVQTVIEGWTGLQAQSDTLHAATTVQQKVLQADFNAYQAAKADLDQLSPDSEEYLDASFKLSMVEKTLEERAKFMQSKFSKQSTRLLENGVRTIHQVCAEFGAREGFSAILMAPPAMPGPSVSLADSVMDLQGRWVIWSNKTFDVSPQIIEILNSRDL
jgi:Skp family chaperone for outer membrane proteins